MKPVLALLFSASFWGFLWFPARTLQEMGLPGIWQLFASYIPALLVLSLARGVRTEGIAHKPLDVLLLVMAAGWTNVAFVFAILQHEVVRVLILFYLSPLWAVVLGHWLLGERVRRITGWMLLLGVGGAGIMLWQEGILSSPPGKGDALALSAGFSFALTNVMTRRLQHLGTALKTQLAWLGGLVVCVLLLAMDAEPFPVVPGRVWLGAVLLGVLGYMFATLAAVYAVSRMPVQRFSIIMLFELLVGAVSAWLLAGEIVEGREWLGGAMILMAGVVAVMADTRRKAYV